MIKPDFIKKEQIWNSVEEFKTSRSLDLNTVPVPILELVELELKIEIVPIHDLIEGNNIDGFLSRDMNRMSIDWRVYFDERYINRLRFTFAHEIGHLVLHRDKIQLCKFETPEDWIKLRLGLPEEDLKWFEWQAYEFGGRLLVPREKLVQEVNARDEVIRRYLHVSDSGDLELLAEYLAVPISKIFVVSEDVIVRRIKSEGLLQAFVE